MVGTATHRVNPANRVALGSVRWGQWARHNPRTHCSAQGARIAEGEIMAMTRQPNGKAERPIALHMQGRTAGLG